MLLHNNLILEKTEPNRLGISGYTIKDRLEPMTEAPRFVIEHKIPWGLWQLAVAFMEWGFKEHRSEVLVQFFFDPETAVWTAWAPPQDVGHLSVSTRKGAEYDEQRKQVGKGVLLATLHHHSEVAAFQSGTDHKDEIQTDGFHVTIGNMDKEPKDRSWHARSSFRKEIWECKPEDFLDPQLLKIPQLLVAAIGEDIPEQWKTNVVKKEYTMDNEDFWDGYNNRIIGNFPTMRTNYPFTPVKDSPIMGLCVENTYRTLDDFPLNKEWKLFIKGRTYPVAWVLSLFNTKPGNPVTPDDVPDRWMAPEESGRICQVLKARRQDPQWDTFVQFVAKLGYIHGDTKTGGEALFQGILKHRKNNDTEPLCPTPELETTDTPATTGTKSGSGNRFRDLGPKPKDKRPRLEVPRDGDKRRGGFLWDL